MENIIFFFSGTGNSLALAQEIAINLDNTELHNMSGGFDGDLSSFERIGFIFPVYYGGVPPMVRDFIDGLKLTKSMYIFGAITRGGMAGSATDELVEIIEQSGGKLSCEFTVMMPGNYIAAYGALPDFIQKTLLSKSDEKAKKITDKIKVKLIDQNLKSSRDTTPLTKKMPDFPTFAKDYRVNHNCSGCNVCAKICPSKNITMINNKPHFDSVCQRCMACIQWCPVAAISYKGQIRARYRHPEIKAEELFRK
ncbi:MAG: EFR1 family ferrodoxin [Ruminococcus sp.]|jgi:ferredoxin/flavodoxin|nr:EFR1 family ferrodoxin [Ruminococcus sp.]